MENALVLKTKLDTKNFDREIAYLQDEAEDLRAILKDAGKLDSDDIKKYESQLEKVNNRLADLYKKQNDINNQGFRKVQDTLSNVNKSASNIGKSIVRWGLTLLGVRSAMTLIRSSMSTLSQYDEQLAKNMEYIRYVIAMALKPLIEYIVSLVFTLLQYINYIAQAWFGVNLFANASAESMEKNAKASGTMAKNIKEARKDLLGFDKINKLSSQDTSSGGASGGDTIPSVDLSKMLPQGEVPDWLKWIADYGDLVQKLLFMIGAGLVAIKLGLTPLQGFGIAIALEGIVELVQDLSSYIDKLDSSLEDHGTTWKDFGKIIQDIGIIITGIGIVIGSVSLALIGLAVAIVGTYVAFYEEISGFLSKGRELIDDFIHWVEDNTGVLFAFFLGILDGLYDFFVDTIHGFIRPMKDVFDGILLIFKGDFVGGFTSIMRGLGNKIISIINRLIDVINMVFSPLRQMITLVGRVTGQNWSITDVKIPRASYLAKGGIINYPGRGVPLVGAIGGEGGQEGVLPLSDETAMERIGEKIGKHIRINLDLTNEMDGRVFSRQLKQINMEDEFARNGG